MSLAILCPGQGGQHPAMFDLVAGIPRAQAVIGPGLRESIAAGADIFRNRLAQPLVCAAILARWEALRERLPAPAMVLGYSVGELAAHAVAGTFTVEACLALAARRAELMDAASPADAGLTAILGLDEARLAALCAVHGAAIAIANGPSHFIVGGTLADLDALEREAGNLGAQASRIKVGVPAHTPHLASAAAAFAEELARAPLRAPALPILAGIDGRMVRDAAEAAHTLAAQIARTVQWGQCMVQAVERGATVLLELGPGSALVRIARELYPECTARSLDEFATLDGAVAWVERMLER